jgi:hypothetical protein
MLLEEASWVERALGVVGGRLCAFYFRIDARSQLIDDLMRMRSGGIENGGRFARVVSRFRARRRWLIRLALFGATSRRVVDRILGRRSFIGRHWFALPEPHSKQCTDRVLVIRDAVARQSGSHFPTCETEPARKVEPPRALGKEGDESGDRSERISLPGE